MAIKIRNRFWGPRLIVSFGNEYPYIRGYPKIQTPNGTGGFSRGYFVRLKVANIGSNSAHNVYGKLIKITYKHEDEIIEITDPSVLECKCTKECRP